MSSHLEARLTQLLSNKASANVPTPEMYSLESHDGVGQNLGIGICERVLLLVTRSVRFSSKNKKDEWKYVYL